MNMDWDIAPVEDGFDARRYAPEFTEQDHQAAREEGYESAQERWHEDFAYKQFVDYHDGVELRRRAALRKNQEETGVTPERLGVMSEAATNLPQDPDLHEPTEVSVPKHPYIREAAVAGMQNNLIKFLERCAEEGIPPEALEDEDGEWSGNEKLADRQRQWQSLGQRLDAFGEDIGDIAEGIEAGDIEFQEELPTMPEPKDPELQRVYDIYDEDRKRNGLADEPTEQESEDHDHEAVARELAPQETEVKNEADTAWDTPADEDWTGGWDDTEDTEE